MPQDDPIKDGLTNTFLKYRVSTDGGRTNAIEEAVIQKGYTPAQPTLSYYPSGPEHATVH